MMLVMLFYMILSVISSIETEFMLMEIPILFCEATHANQD